ncbi:MAG: flagellar type III secretion system protein FlhB [Alphaproteobacteria bacterium]|nr:flagellar type III secretion system protein FlhB [Alphaproteobacteria bacterium]
MSDEDDDKQFEPSQKKLDDARKKGEFPKSTDLTTAAAYGGFLVAVASVGSGSLIGAGTVLEVLLDQVDDLSVLALSGSAQPVLGGLFWAVAVKMLPWFALPAAFALLAIAAQQAFVIAPSRIAPKVSRISPIAGAKNKLGRQGLFEFGKSLVKLMIYGTVMGIYLWSARDRMMSAMSLSPGMVTVVLGQMMMTLMLIVVAIALTLGIVDLLWQRAEHARKHRMSRKEMMDEMKESDGDPAMKQQRRQRAIDLAMNQMLADVPQASVVIVNPTHFAVALSWGGTAGSAPVCVAKGVDDVAARIREIATESGVPIHSDPPTARVLHATVDIGQEIAPDHYQAVAAAIRFAQAMRAKAARRP